MKPVRLTFKQYVFRKPVVLNRNIKGYWFIIGVKKTSLWQLDYVVELVEKMFNIKCQRQGIGKYQERQADFFVKTEKKRNQIQRYIARNVGCRFYKVK